MRGSSHAYMKISGEIGDHHQERREQHRSHYQWNIQIENRLVSQADTRPIENRLGENDSGKQAGEIESPASATSGSIAFAIAWRKNRARDPIALAKLIGDIVGAADDGRPSRLSVGCR